MRPSANATVTTQQPVFNNSIQTLNIEHWNARDYTRTGLNNNLAKIGIETGMFSFCSFGKSHWSKIKSEKKLRKKLKANIKTSSTEKKQQYQWHSLCIQMKVNNDNNNNKINRRVWTLPVKQPVWIWVCHPQSKRYKDRWRHIEQSSCLYFGLGRSLLSLRTEQTEAFGMNDFWSVIVFELIKLRNRIDNQNCSKEQFCVARYWFMGIKPRRVDGFIKCIKCMRSEVWWM